MEAIAGSIVIGGGLCLAFIVFLCWLLGRDNYIDKGGNGGDWA
jgi:hypothetical protein